MDINITNPIFHDEAKATAHMEADRWPDGAYCPHCGSVNVRKMGGETQAGMFQCNGCRDKFTVRTGTVFERSHIPLHKWLLATHIMAASKKSVSALQLQRMLGLGSYRTAWFMCHRIREAMKPADPSPIGGENKVVEADETFIGGKKKNRAYAKKEPKKQIVMTLVERDGKSRSFHVANVSAKTLREKIVTTVPGRVVDDIKQAYTTEQLAEIGAIALAWNQVDSYVDFMLLVALKIPVGLWLEVAKRINGMDGKLTILRKRGAQSKILTDEARACIKSALDAVAEYKTYRDAIIHSMMWDLDKGIAQRIGSRAEVHQILVTMEALSALYERLVILQTELRQVDLLFRLADEDGAASVYRGFPDPSRLRRERDVPAVTAQALAHQNRRLSLPPLPEFPTEEDRDAAAMDWMQQLSQSPDKSEDQSKG